MSEALDWAGMMHAGLRGLRLSSSDFWNLTPGELAFLIGSDAGPLRMDRAALDRLAERFPDISETCDD